MTIGEMTTDSPGGAIAFVLPPRESQAWLRRAR
jgi:hypothetical protein